MARDADELLTRMLGWLPPEYEDLADLLAAFAAAQERVEELVEEFAPLVTITEGEGIWLTLQAKGYGLERGTDEPDSSLKTRMRNVQDAVTPVALVDAADELLAPYTTDSAYLVEWFDEPWLDVDDDDEGGAWLDQVRCTSMKSFILVVPLLGGGFGPSESPVYASILSEIDRLRAADFRWLLALE